MRLPHRITAAALVSLLACVEPTQSGAGEGGLSLRFEGSAETTGELDSGYVILRGPTPKTVKAMPGEVVRIDNLRTGTYTVALEGFALDGVARFYDTSGVTITPNQMASVTVPMPAFAPFVPTMNPLPPTNPSLSFTVGWGTMPRAMSYEVELATNETFTANRLQFSTMEASTTVTVPNAGTYYVRVRAIDAYQGRGRACASQTITVSNPTPPRIALSSTSISFSAPPGGANPAAQTVSVTNSGGGTLSGLSAPVTYSAGQPTGWLTASLSTTSAPSTLTLAATTGSLGVGTYTASVAVTSAVASNSPQTVSVTFTVTLLPTIVLSPTSRTFSAARGGANPPVQTVAVTNGGGGTLSGLSTSPATYTAGQPTGWLTANLSLSTAPSTLTLTATTGSLAVGTYTASVAVTSAVASNSPQVVYVTFTITPGAVSAAQSAVSAAPTTIQASNGQNVSTITVTARDASGTPIQGLLVILTASGTGNTLIQPAGTNANGVATGTLSSTVTGTKSVSATIDGTLINQTATVTVTPGPVSATQSTVTAAPTSIPASNGTSTSTITITARDAFGNPILATVVLAASGTGNTLSQPGGTNASGVATATLSSTVTGTKTISATIGGTAITQTATMTVTPGPVSASQSTVSAAPLTIPPSSGASYSTITVTARDAFGNLISGATVGLAASPPGGNLLTQPTGPTNASGVATGTYSSTVAGTKTISATISGTAITQTATVNVTSVPVSTSLSTVVAAPTTITASSGTSVSTITVTARDALGNPISGIGVVLAASGTGNTLTQPGVTTNASGVTTGTLSSTVTGAKNVTATINGTTITMVATVTVVAPLITFETFPDGSAACESCALTNQFASFGVTFTNETLMNSTIYDAVGGPTNHSANTSNVSAVSTMTFPDHPHTVTFRLRANNQNPTFLVTAVDGNGAAVPTAQITHTSVSTYTSASGFLFRQETITVTSAAGLASINVDGRPVYGMLVDNLQIQP